MTAAPKKVQKKKLVKKKISIKKTALSKKPKKSDKLVSKVAKSSIRKKILSRKKKENMKKTHLKTHIEVVKKESIYYNEIKQMLLKMKASIMEALEKKKLSPDEEKNMEIEELDAMAEERNREYEYLLTSMDIKKLREIDEALTKIDNGTYGFCEDCGEPIPIARLKALPFAKLCIDCASNLEQEEAIRQSLQSEKDIFSNTSNEEEGEAE